MLNATELKRQIWHSRRGMLELDVLLEPFARHELANLEADQQLVYIRLLAQQDPDLFAWFMGQEICDDKELADMIERIQQYATTGPVS
ncbi:MAG: succinate dehydrogenase assembly factor 2 [Gammaproteobacteria bacterium]|jgi:antitoxin CptB|nr:succinate dehydrogenase assembly factor 2 [Gammaproteobacteria bacterium]